MKISLKPEVQRLVEQQLKTGRFASADEVVEAAVVQLTQNGALARPCTEVDELREQIAVGIAQLEGGEGGDWDVNEVRAEGQRLLNAAKGRAS